MSATPSPSRSDGCEGLLRGLLPAASSTASAQPSPSSSSSALSPKPSPSSSDHSFPFIGKSSVVSGTPSLSSSVSAVSLSPSPSKSGGGGGTFTVICWFGTRGGGSGASGMPSP